MNSAIKRQYNRLTKKKYGDKIHQNLIAIAFNGAQTIRRQNAATGQQASRVKGMNSFPATCIACNKKGDKAMTGLHGKRKQRARWPNSANKAASKSVNAENSLPEYQNELKTAASPEGGEGQQKQHLDVKPAWVAAAGLLRQAPGFSDWKATTSGSDIRQRVI